MPHTTTKEYAMPMISQRATEAEKAQAWDHLMASKKADGDAIQDAYQDLTSKVLAREKRTQAIPVAHRESRA